MAFVLDLTPLLALEAGVASLQNQPPSSLVGGAQIAVTYRGTAAGAPSTITTQQLGARLQALLLAVQTLPQ